MPPAKDCWLLASDGVDLSSFPALRGIERRKMKETEFDALDREILGALLEDGRLARSSLPSAFRFRRSRSRDASARRRRRVGSKARRASIARRWACASPSSCRRPQESERGLAQIVRGSRGQGAVRVPSSDVGRGRLPRHREGAIADFERIHKALSPSGRRPAQSAARIASRLPASCLLPSANRRDDNVVRLARAIGPSRMFAIVSPLDIML
jgi:hypothetical protein